MGRNLPKSTGEPDAVKAARPVRRGLVGKVPAYGQVTRWLATLHRDGARGKLVAKCQGLVAAPRPGG